MSTQPTRRLRPTRVAALAFLVLVALEVLAIRFVALRIGGGATLLLLVATSVLGGWVVSREGRRRWQALVDAVRAGRPPQREVADGMLVLLGGLLLLLPGFVSDVLGLLLVLPLTRALARRLLVPLLGQRLLVRVTGPGGGPGFARMRGERSTGEVIQGHVVSGDAVRGEVVEGEVVDPDPRPDENGRA
ncbi:MAG TPA: FxsA family protein [Intrasporangium sp.]|nr:FxsA family protein [Intrasporangium sp.]